MSNDNNENKNKIRRKKVSSSTNKSSSSTPSNKKRPKSSPKKDKFKFLRVAGIVFLVLLVVGAAAGTGLVFASLKNIEPVTKALLDEKTYQITQIRYSTGDLLSNAPSINKKDPVRLEEINDNLKKAVIAIEDERFYEHSGVDIKGLLRSVVRTIAGTKQGGSTIPMQVSKMLLTSKEQSIPRKIKDIYYAYEMSKTLTKDEILEVYLNNFFVGKGLAGAEAGAHGYFDTTAKELTLAQSALLAGSTKNPSRYSAYKTAKLEGNEIKEDVENKLLFFINTPDDILDDPTAVELEMIEKLKDLGDDAGVSILTRIYEDEIGHVERGTYWFNVFARKQALNPEQVYKEKIIGFYRGKPKGPFNREVRIIAGFTNNEIDWLEGRLHE